MLIVQKVSQCKNLSAKYPHVLCTLGWINLVIIWNFSVADANIGEDLLPSLSRDYIKDLFPGPENFLRRRALWLVVHKHEKVSSLSVAVWQNWEHTCLSLQFKVITNPVPLTTFLFLADAQEEWTVFCVLAWNKYKCIKCTGFVII